MPGFVTTPPIVQTAPSPVRFAISRISSSSRAAPASASRRLSIGVEPACAAWPRNVTWGRSTPNGPSTTPSGRSSDSSTGPCSMCRSRYAAAPWSSVRASSGESRSTPWPRSASGSGRAGGAAGGAPARLLPCAEIVLILHRAGSRGRSEEGAPEPRALLVGPVHEPHGDGRLAIGGDSPEDLDAGPDVQAPLAPAHGA